MEIWINPACSKCRTAKAALDEAGVDYVERRYLDDPPSAAELGEVVARMGLEPWDVARPKEAAEAGIDLPRDPGHRDAWLAALAANPRAIQRPILTADDGTTAVARDPETLARFL
jgi:arsenate reductase